LSQAERKTNLKKLIGTLWQISIAHMQIILFIGS